MLHAWIYNIGTGSVDAFDETQGQFISLSEFPNVRASSPRCLVPAFGGLGRV